MKIGNQYVTIQDSEVYYNAIRMKMEKAGFHKVSPRSDHHEMYKAIKRGS